jgi:hypothetical protein
VLINAETVLGAETGKQIHAFICRADGTVTAAATDGFIGRKVPADAVGELISGQDTASAQYRWQKVPGGGSVLIGAGRSRGFETYKTGWAAVIIEK